MTDLEIEMYCTVAIHQLFHNKVLYILDAYTNDMIKTYHKKHLSTLTSYSAATGAVKHKPKVSPL